ncbi:MAG: hypothetical protein K6C13_11820 [Oscillospiraceae bacterium]|nr:hypothetical protein [Oscillospiraceae bacterium]
MSVIVFIGRYRIKDEYRKDLQNYLNKSFDNIKNKDLINLSDKWDYRGIRYLNTCNSIEYFKQKDRKDQKASLYQIKYSVESGMMSFYHVCDENTDDNLFWYDFLEILHGISEEALDLNKELSDAIVTDKLFENSIYRVYINGRLES